MLISCSEYTVSINIHADVHLAKDACPGHDSLYGEFSSTNGHLHVCEARLLALGTVQHENVALRR